MGLFSKADTCCICNINDGKKKIADGYVCRECLYKSVPHINVLSLKNVSRTDVQMAIEKNDKAIALSNSFVTTQKVDKLFEIDEQNKMFMIPNSRNKISPAIICNYSDILEYELLEDGDSITKGGLGRAVAGGLLFGGVGAIVGGVTGGKKTKKVINSMQIKITTRDTSSPIIMINILQGLKVKSTSIIYKSACESAQKILSLLAIIVDSQKSREAEAVSNSNSMADELIKLKELLDSNVITEEEFQSAKSKILNI